MNQKKAKAIRKLCKAIGVKDFNGLKKELSKFSATQILADIPLAKVWREAYDNRAKEGSSN